MGVCAAHLLLLAYYDVCILTFCVCPTKPIIEPISLQNFLTSRGVDGAERDLEEDNDYSVEMMDASCLDKEEIFPKVKK